MAVSLAEVWCDRCSAPADRIVVTGTGPKVLCKKHADDLEYRLYSNAWNPGKGSRAEKAAATVTASLYPVAS